MRREQNAEASSLSAHRKGDKRLGLIAAVFACVLGLGLMASCSPQQPQPAPSTEEDPAVSTEADDGVETLVKDFTEADSGVFDESHHTDNFVNDGNRGCNTCHVDLWDLTENCSMGIAHLASSDPGYGKNATINDCLSCHHGTSASGPYIKDLIHTRHYSSKEFVDDDYGNCMSCHAINIEGEFVMYDYWKYSREFGGYPTAGDPAYLEWLEMRGWPNGNMSGVMTEAEPTLSVEFDHEPSDEEDMFWANNTPIPEFDESAWTLSIVGVNNPREFTLEELRELPQTDRTVCLPCGANTIGSYQVANVPVTGVLLSDIIEACGGLADENSNALEYKTVDNWQWPKGLSYDLNTLLDVGGMVVLQHWGEDIGHEEGYPAALCWPGQPAAFGMKWLTELDFTTSDSIVTGLWQMVSAYGSYPTEPGDVEFRDSGGGVNSGWINPSNDGATFKLGETVTLEGYSYVWQDSEHFVDKVEFSFNYGDTWTVFDVPDDYDHAAWTHWVIEWEPTAPGTYVLYSNTRDGNGTCQMSPSPLIVIIEE